MTENKQTNKTDTEELDQAATPVDPSKPNRFTWAPGEVEDIGMVVVDNTEKKYKM